jgi:hypothetical protein
MNSIHLIDNFYSNPFEIRDFALNQKFTKFKGATFAGTQTEESFYSDSIIKKIELKIGKNIKVDPKRNVFGGFRLSLQDDYSLTKVHFDRGQWAMVVYLTPITDFFKGTIIYSFIENNFNCPQKFIDEGLFKDRNEVASKIITPNTKTMNKWNEIWYNQFKFNNAILFRGDSLFHSAGPSFGNNLETGRLTHQFFFNEVDYE